MADSQYSIQWQPWRDVLKEAFNEFKKKSKENEYEKLVEADYSGPIMHTDLGIFPINETTFPSSTFNFWRGNTIGFILTHRMGLAIMNTLGVETFNVYTPYRFRIAIATGFNVDDVKRRVESAVLALLNNTVETPSNSYDLLRKQYKFFAVGESDIKKVLFGNTKEEVEKQLNELKLPSGIRIYYSWKQ